MSNDLSYQETDGASTPVSAANPLPTTPWRTARKTVTFDGTAGGGQAATAVTVFTQTGQVLMGYLFARCTTTLVGATATVDLKASDGYTFVGTTTAIDLAAGDSWIDTSPAETVAGLVPAAMKDVALNGGTVAINPATADVTAGVLELVMLWLPLSTDGDVA